MNIAIDRFCSFFSWACTPTVWVLQTVGVLYDTESHGVLYLLQEGPLRPVLECIDLLTDSDDEGCSSLAGTVSDWNDHLFNRYFEYMSGFVSDCFDFFSALAWR